MLDKGQHNHFTTAIQIPGEVVEGWEFHCEDCNFRMRYFVSGCSQEARLEVISLGDKEIRHLSNTAFLDQRNQLNEENWLTAQIRETIGRIFNKYES